MSFLEQSTIVKTGTTCVIGSADEGLQWGVLVSDFLLNKVSIGGKFDRIVCACLDRSHKDVRETMNQNSSSNILDIITIQPSLSPRDVVAALTPTVPTSRSILFLNSFSELIFMFGYQCALKLLHHFKGIFTSVVATVHKSLHSPQLINLMPSTFVVTVVVKPNDGTMASDVTAEIHCLRKSISGRVSEASELFGHREGFLFPLHETRSIPHSSKAVDAEDSESSNSTKVLASIDMKSGATKKEDVVPKVSGGEASPNFHQALPGVQRLVTFDSTDPEFDEDSDPDNDLDL